MTQRLAATRRDHIIEHSLRYFATGYATQPILLLQRRPAALNSRGDSQRSVVETWTPAS